MENMDQLVSVILVSFNGEAYLQKAIESVLNQSYKNFEFLLVDNGSHDDTRSIMKGFQKKDSRIRVITYDKNISRTPCYNEMVPLAKGKLIFEMCDDDIMLPDRLRGLLKFMIENPELHMANSLFYYIDESDRILAKNHTPHVDKEWWKKVVAVGGLINLPTPGMTYWKASFIEVGGYRPKFWPADDLEFATRFAMSGKAVATLDKVLLHYRIHSQSVMAKEFLDASWKCKWLLHCVQKRKLGKEEISFEEFMHIQKKKPLLTKVQWYMNIYGDKFYREAGLLFGKRKYLSFFFFISLSFLMIPSSVIKKIRQQML
ncbi:glycosyltransferase family 2 protein [Xanthovirga aplysinae]|uniref:glycosyltransferase family 2 protein n=1 Tax=Xanthovirga aplysinae TaxID=2529853 RepID=UPI0012BC800A|nr:glycosyltransferase [Xanthovirga aplysinae]MTI30284.1 glycosyltransferase [Xanthovirga aplysinae]